MENEKEKKKKTISDAVIRRLPRYYRYLGDLQIKGIVRISSKTLGEKMGINASQIRQDLSCFGGFGQQGYGYNVEELRAALGRILGVDKRYGIIVVGVGNLGRALIQNFRFTESGFLLGAAFDVSPALIGGEVAGVPILSVKELERFVPLYKPDVAVLTVPRAAAQTTADRLIGLGVRGFWNFTGIELAAAVEGVKFENVHFADSLLTLSYRVTQPDNEPGENTVL